MFVSCKGAWDVFADLFLANVNPVTCMLQQCSYKAARTASSKWVKHCAPACTKRSTCNLAVEFMAKRARTLTLACLAEMPEGLH